MPHVHTSHMDTIRSMLDGWEKKYDTQAEQDDYMTVFAEDVQWFDHAFRVVRIGREAIAGLFVAWLHCNQPFSTTTKHLHPTPTGVVAELVWHGRTANDIVRPDGTVSVKATGREYDCATCMIFQFDPASGAIARIDEYYNKQWDDGVAEEKYLPMRGASMKQ